MNTVEFLNEMERRAKAGLFVFLTIEEEIRLYTDTGVAVSVGRVNPRDYTKLYANPSSVIKAVEEGRAILNEQVVKRLTS